MKAVFWKFPGVSLLMIGFAFGAEAQTPVQADTPKDAPKIVGSWKLNLSKSTFANGQPLRSRLLDWLWDGDTLIHVNRSSDAKGEKTVAIFSVKFDGKDYPVFENGSDRPLRYVRMRMADPYTLEITSRKDGKDLTTFRHTVSKDRKTDTITQVGSTVDGGRTATEVLVYDRQ
jgi:hypothetical protein